jgi:hypothetical protein
MVITATKTVSAFFSYVASKMGKSGRLSVRDALEMLKGWFKGDAFQMIGRFWYVSIRVAEFILPKKYHKLLPRPR